MNPEDELTAADILNTYDAIDLAKVLRYYGEEKFAKRIADAVVVARTEEPFTNSARLVDLIRSSIPAAARRTGGNPAKRTFQALRIEVNDELGSYRRALPAALDVLAPGGRVVVLVRTRSDDRCATRSSVCARGAPGEVQADHARRRGRHRRRDRGQLARPLRTPSCCRKVGGMNVRQLVNCEVAT